MLCILRPLERSKIKAALKVKLRSRADEERKSTMVIYPCG